MVSVLRKAPQGWLDAAWTLGAALVILVLPLWIRTFTPPWQHEPPDQLQAWVWAVCWLVFAVAMTFTRGLTGLARLAVATGLLIACFAVGYAALLLVPGAQVSRLIALYSAALAAALGLKPLVTRRRVALLGTVVLAGLMAAVPQGGETPEGERRADMAIASARYLLRIGGTLNAVPVAVGGGAIETLDDGFLLVTADGAFSFVTRAADGETFAVEALPIPSPLNSAAFAADQAIPEAPQIFRVTDIALAADAVPLRLYAAHQFWNSAEKCVTIRVSVTTVDRRSWSSTPWTSVYETRPCLAPTGAFTDNETGGRLAWLGEHLLLSVGDHGFGLERRLAQDAAADYGKILELDLQGGRTLVSSGHRNPQGLLVRRDGTIWSTEHGPQGGDEINVIRKGANFGWPYQTEGTQYGLRYWPLKPEPPHAPFTLPAQVFTPSIGISSIVELAGSSLPNWNGDLLVGSLVGQSLYRVAVAGDRVVSTERIEVGHRLRDIAQGRDGRIVVWTDEGHLLTVDESHSLPAGEAVYAQCAACHGDDLGGTPSGPSLRALFDRRIGRAEGFASSPSLQTMTGIWTPARLDEFLADPAAFAPGTTMRMSLPDAAERKAVIDYLSRAW